MPKPAKGPEDSVTRALHLLGERWTMLILREAFFGVRRYGQFAQQVGIPRPTLSDRLAKLVRLGLLRKEQYGGGPIRADYEYRLTEAGHELFPVMMTMMEWGDRYLPDDGDEPAPGWTHDDCGERTHPVLTCDRCGQPVTSRNVHLNA